MNRFLVTLFSLIFCLNLCAKDIYTFRIFPNIVLHYIFQYDGERIKVSTDGFGDEEIIVNTTVKNMFIANDGSIVFIDFGDNKVASLKFSSDGKSITYGYLDNKTKDFKTDKLEESSRIIDEKGVGLFNRLKNIASRNKPTYVKKHSKSTSVNSYKTGERQKNGSSSSSSSSKNILQKPTVSSQSVDKSVKKHSPKYSQQGEYRIYEPLWSNAPKEMMYQWYEGTTMPNTDRIPQKMTNKCLGLVGNYGVEPSIYYLSDRSNYEVKVDGDIMKLVARKKTATSKYTSLSKPITLRVVEIKAFQAPSKLWMYYVTIIEDEKIYRSFFR